MMQKTLRFPVLFSVALLPFFPGASTAQTVDCDTVPVVAQATAGHLTCLQPTATLTGTPDPSALSYLWTGPNGFVSTNRVTSSFIPGTYLLTVTGKYGCTAQTTVVLADSCTFFPLEPPECADPLAPGADLCAGVCVRPFINGQYSYTGDYTPDNVPGFCGTIENNQWYAFVAGATSGSITVQPDSCAFHNGVQVALFDGCNEPPLFCNPGFEGNDINPVTINVDSLIIGKVYYLMVDGYSGDLCTFALQSSGGVCDGGNPHTPTPPKLAGSGMFCPNSTLPYAVSGNVTASAFLWTAPPGALINGVPGPLLLYTPAGKSVNITFGDQEGEVCVRLLYYFHKPDPPLCISVKKTQIPPTILPTGRICFEDLPFIWEEEPFTILNSPGTFNLVSTPYQSYLGCDSVVRQQIIVMPPILTSLGVVTRCAGDCFEIGGDSYCEPGVYLVVLESWQGCDSLVNFQLQVLNPVAEILGAGTLNCLNPAITLTAAPATGSLTWYNGSGQLIGSGAVLKVQQPGTYILRNAVSVSGKICTKADTVIITADPPVLVTAQGTTLSCTTPYATLSSSIQPASSTAQWTGPNGFVSFSPNPVVSLPGIYTLVATAPNGCTGVATVEVIANVTPPGASASGGTLTCAQPQIQLTATSDTAPVLFEWMGPGGFYATIPTPETNLPGVYTLVVTGANGCQSTAETVVEADQEPPPVALSSGTITCVVHEIVLDAGVNQPATYMWSGPIGILVDIDHLVVDQPGVYTVTVTAANGCTATATAEVLADTTAPEVTASADTLTCSMANVYLHAGSNVAGAQFEWAGPGGFAATGPDPAVSEPGPYNLTATNPSNGCMASVSVSVVSDQTLPAVDVFQTPPGCADSLLFAMAASNASGAVFTWTGPNGFVAQGAAIEVNTAGWYKVEALAANGCSSEISILMVAAPPNPTVMVTTDAISCLHPNAEISATADVAGTAFTWTDATGMVTSGPELVTASPGSCQVVAFTPEGCVSVLPFSIPADTVAPDLTATGGVLTCEQPEISLKAVSDTPGATISWAGGTGVPGASTLAVSEPGNYTAVATAPNGCTQSVTVLVIDSCAVVATADPAGGTGIRVFPNASKGVVFVQALGVEPVSACRVFRSDGVQAFQQVFAVPAVTVRLDLQAQPAGAYRISARIGGRWFNQPLILLE